MSNRTGKKLHLNLFLHGRGHHEASWRHPAASPLALTDIRYYQQLAQRAEAGLLDSIFLADQLALDKDVGSAPRAWLEPVTGACRRARELVTEACGRWNVPELAGPASLVLSELVGNVVRHAGTPMQVTLTLRRPYLRVAVMDGSPADAYEATSRDPRAEGGRGLMLVRELTQRWGSTPVGAGKVVWAMLPAN